MWSHNPSRLIGLVSQRGWYTNRSSNAARDSPELISASFGATFFHKHYLHTFTELFSPTVQHMVDHADVCEDLLLNWLIVQLSGHSVLTTINAAGNRVHHGPRGLPVPRQGEMCHLEPYGECWSRLSHRALARSLGTAVPFRVARMSADLM
ncbi:unnamed protein product [Echinostoma caproni]|uniref:Glycosyl transferase 64 domain-containing protein n=1 Tax=Echinostoma caproni TaxID=27848 RepID=A0A3P8G921_9TREM|nr:unnamed protein product [Echinostoma caproni]